MFIARTAEFSEILTKFEIQLKRRKAKLFIIIFKPILSISLVMYFTGLLSQKTTSHIKKHISQSDRLDFCLAIVVFV